MNQAQEHPARDLPMIRAGFRLQWEEVQGAHVLLYPEGMIKLNGSAAEILRPCDGSRTIEQIVRDLEQTFECNELWNDVVDFVDGAVRQGWVSMVQR